jgi:hypothetical protein
MAITVERRTAGCPGLRDNHWPAALFTAACM